MSLTKEKKIDQITIDEHGNLFYREATVILENGVELSKAYHRISLHPGQDLTDQPQTVVDIANVVWTDAIIAAYQDKLSNPSIVE